VYELRPAVQTKGQEGNALAGEAGTGVYPGKIIGMLPSCAGMVSGKLRCSWS